jgi:hypothetical protein
MGSISGWFWLRQHSYEAQLPSRIVGMTVSCSESPLFYPLTTVYLFASGLILRQPGARR